jgi:hypothetical protein
MFTGMSSAAIGLAGAITTFAIPAFVAFEFASMHDKNSAGDLINSLTQLDHATGDNMAGYQKLASQLGYYQQHITDVTGKVYGLYGAITTVTNAQHQLSQAQAQAIQTATNLRNNFNYLERTYHISQQQAYQLAKAVGVDLTKALNFTSKVALANYEQALKAAQNPMTALQYDMSLAANQSMSLADRVTALGNAFNVLLTPLNSVIGDTVTFTNDSGSLLTALKASNGVIGNNTTAQRASAQAMVQAYNDASQLSQAILNQTGSASKAMGPLIALRNELIRSGASGSWARQEIAALSRTIAGLQSKAVTVTTHFVVTGTPPGQGGSPGGYSNPGNPGGYAAGTNFAPAGWSWVGENGPELMHLRGGEQIKSGSASSQAAAGAAGGGDITVKVYLDGEELRASTAKATYNNNFANGNRLRGGRPSGVMRPR